MKKFDYIFFRIYSFFLNQKDNVPEAKGSILLSLLQFLTLVSIPFILTVLIDMSLPSKWHFVPIMLIIGIYNWNRYERNLDLVKLSEQWNDEDILTKKKRGWLIVTWFVVVILIPVSIGVLRHNLGVL